MCCYGKSVRSIVTAVDNISVCLLAGMLSVVNLQPFAHQSSPVASRTFMAANGAGGVDMYQTSGQEAIGYMQANASPQPSSYTYVCIHLSLLAACIA
jgi:hypothetical protein